MTVARRDWRGSYAHPDAVQVEAFEAFGWKVHRHRMPAGSAMVLTASAEVERERAPNLTLYTRGLISVRGGDGTAFEDRVPGMYSAERPNHPAGVVTLTAVQDSEFWCFNWHANRAALPALVPIRLQQGQSLQVSSGQRLWLFRGQAAMAGYTLPIPSSLLAGEDGELVALEATYGVIVEADRAA